MFNAFVLKDLTKTFLKEPKKIEANKQKKQVFVKRNKCLE